jgi:hypothetical protein
MELDYPLCKSGREELPANYANERGLGRTGGWDAEVPPTLRSGETPSFRLSTKGPLARLFSQLKQWRSFFIFHRRKRRGDREQEENAESEVNANHEPYTFTFTYFALCVFSGNHGSASASERAGLKGEEANAELCWGDEVRGRKARVEFHVQRAKLVRFLRYSAHYQTDIQFDMDER